MKYTEKEVAEELLRFLSMKIKNEQKFCEKDGIDFVDYVGLSENNLRQMLKLDKTFDFFEVQNLRWKDIYGKEASVDLQQSMKSEIEKNENALNEKKQKILEQFEEHLLPAIKRKGDAYFAIWLLDIGNDFGLHSILTKEKSKDYSFLLDINKDTFRIIQLQADAVSIERGGVFSKREERLMDLLISIDDFIQQRYEICRYKLIKEIYSILLEKLKDFWILFPDENVSSEIEIRIEEKKVLERIEQEFLKKLDLDTLVKSLAHEMLTQF